MEAEYARILNAGFNYFITSSISHYMNYLLQNELINFTVKQIKASIIFTPVPFHNVEVFKVNQDFTYTDTF